MKDHDETPKHIVFIDCGDTLVDEASQVFDNEGTVLRADIIPGADRLLRELKTRGFRVALVADGRARSFENILRHNGMRGYFDAFAISEVVGVEKPDRAIFDAAMKSLGCGDIDDPRRIVMTGNNLSRDIRGANLLGFTTVWIDWAPRRAKVPADEVEKPDFVITMPLELVDVLEGLERGA